MNIAIKPENDGQRRGTVVTDRLDQRFQKSALFRPPCRAYRPRWSTTGSYPKVLMAAMIRSLSSWFGRDADVAEDGAGESLEKKPSTRLSQEPAPRE